MLNLKNAAISIAIILWIACGVVFLATFDNSKQKMEVAQGDMPRFGGGPVAIYQVSLLPASTTAIYDLGTSTRKWNTLFANFASTTALNATTLCLDGDTCRTTWPSTAAIWPFTIGTYAGQNTSASSTLLHLTGSPLSLAASSTFFTQASTTLLTNTGTSYLSNLTITNSSTSTFSGGLYATQIAAPYFNATSTTATSTFKGSVSILGNLNVAGNFYGTVQLVTSGDATVNGALTVTGATTLATSLNGAVSAASGVISAGTLSIANGGTNATSFGTSNGIVAYNGSSLVNFANFTLVSSLLTAPQASTTHLTIGTSLGIPVGTAPILTSSGYVAVNSSSTAPALTFFDGTAQQALPAITEIGFIWSTTTPSAGTTTFATPPFRRSTKLTDMSCTSNGGTANAQVGSGAASSTMVTSTTGLQGTFTTLASNNTFTRGQSALVSLGTWSGTTVTEVRCNWGKQYNI